ncbi:unnamed protein product [Haemonchus placei]|uniref:Pentatricopeptide repeat-containing protein n=1 Tax=Haemonchus placei TaxID=6290 RepID=A0A0N4WX83_HAEPC|nr:unnamed protein product [Haemonchus placei]
MVNCAVCGKIIYAAKAKRTTGSLPQNAILFMSLALAGHMDMELARKLLDPATKKREYVCQRHVVQAAQFLLAEMAMLGSRIRHFDDPSASGRTAYVAFVDIPQSIVHNLNYASEVDVEESQCGEGEHDAGEEARDFKVSEEEHTESPEEDSGEVNATYM